MSAPLCGEPGYTHCPDCGADKRARHLADCSQRPKHPSEPIAYAPDLLADLYYRIICDNAAVWEVEFDAGPGLVCSVSDAAHVMARAITGRLADRRLACTAQQGPPLGNEQPANIKTCVRVLSGLGADEVLCGATAVAHIAWNEEGDNGVACPMHLLEAVEQGWAFDLHSMMALCTMPGTSFLYSWTEQPGRCIVDGLDDAMPVLVAAMTPPANNEVGQ